MGISILNNYNSATVSFEKEYVKKQHSRECSFGTALTKEELFSQWEKKVKENQTMPRFSTHIIGQEADVTIPNQEKNSAEEAFNRVAPNAPASVKNAWLKAADIVGVNGMGIMSDGKMSHISQLLVKQVENRMKGIANYTDVLGSSVRSAKTAIEEALFDLEHPLVPESTRGAKIQKCLALEKEFYRTFLKQLNSLKG